MVTMSSSETSMTKYVVEREYNSDGCLEWADPGCRWTQIPANAERFSDYSYATDVAKFMNQVRVADRFECAATVRCVEE